MKARQVIGVSLLVICMALLWNIYSVQMDLPAHNPPLVRSQGVPDLHAAAIAQQEQLLLDLDAALDDAAFRYRVAGIFNSHIQQNPIPGTQIVPAQRTELTWWQKICKACNCSGARR